MYQTGTVLSPTALKTVIETFCTDNGWTLSGSDYLYKGQSNVKLTVPAGPSTTYLNIGAANSSDGVTEPASYERRIIIAADKWPVTYYLFAHTTPDVVVCVLNYDTSKVQYILFGDMQKLHASAYVGGNFFFASGDTGYTSVNSAFSITDTYIVQYGDSAGTNVGPIPFFPSYKASVTTGLPYYYGVHAKVDGHIWGTTTSPLALSDTTIASLYRSPNTWNSQAQLVPIQLEFQAASSFRSYLGYIEHIRFVRNDNYELGDIITLGSDKWKVFPGFQKDSTNRNGTSWASGIRTSGTIGIAIRYDGP